MPGWTRALLLLALLLPRGSASQGAPTVTLAFDYLNPPVPARFVVQRSQDLGATWESVGTVPGAVGSGLTWTDASVPTATIPPVLRYRVQAQTSRQTSAPSNTVVVSPAGARRLPGPVLAVAGVDSEELTAEHAPATHALDGDLTTMWHTQWSGGTAAPLPHWIVLDLGGLALIDGVAYVPRQGSEWNGTITQFEVALSEDTHAWNAPVAAGTWTWGTERLPQIVRFMPAKARFVRLTARGEHSGGPWTSAAELAVYASAAADWVPPAPVGGTCTRTQPAPKVVVLTCIVP